MKNKALKIILCIVVLVIVIAVIIFGIIKLTAKNPTDSVTSFIEYLKSGDLNGAKEYTNESGLEMLGIDSETEDIEMVKLFFKNVNLNIVEVTKDSNQAIVKVEITNRDLKTIMQNYMQKALELAMSSINSSNTTEDMESQLQEFFKSQFESTQIENVTTSVDIVLIKIDGDWKIVLDENLRDAILPGLTEISNLYTTMAS